MKNNKLESFQKSYQGDLDTQGIRSIKDIYYDKSSNKQSFDIYYPPVKKTLYPMIVYIHGGAFIKGDKKRYQLYSPLQGIYHGYAVVSLNYRLLPEGDFIDALKDVITAINYIIQYAKEYQIDIHKMVLWGESAGATLAVYAITHGTFPIHMQAVIDWYGSIDFENIEKQLKEKGIRPLMIDGQTIHRHKFKEENEIQYHKVLKKLNPYMHDFKYIPAFYIEHGIEDDIVPVQQSIDLYHFLKKQSMNHHKLKIIEGLGHGVKGFDSNENLNDIFIWLTSIL